MYATGWSLHLPGADIDAALAPLLSRPAGDWARRAAPAPDRASVLLGRKGLLSKEPATRLALCAVHSALGLPAGQRPRWPMAPRTAVIACSNLGNVRTVAAVTAAIAAEGGRGVSILDAPNASSNIVASTVALWFGFGGPNLMVCSGSMAGRDGLMLAGLLLRSGRADRVVLVGAEHADEVATALFGFGEPGPPLRTGAACVILEPLLDGQGAEIHVQAPWPARPRLTIGRGGFDPAAAWGDCYGAQGVVALALAAHLAADEGRGPLEVRGDGPDGPMKALVSACDRRRG